MLLRNLQITGSNRVTDILVRDGKINAISNFTGLTGGMQVIDFENVIAFPGLINSHDHLDFNLFPQLGSRRYNNYVEWGSVIHKEHKGAIDAVLKVPKALRIQWGIYKNLVSGITTVVNHGERLNVNNELISVFQQTHTLHSVQNEQYWRYKLNRPFIKEWPFVIHIGEGLDHRSHREIDKLVQWNLYKRNIIGVHGIAMNEKQAVNFKAIVWCPVSNYFLTGNTAPIHMLKHFTNILFGTDATLSAGWNIWEHLRLARNEKMVSDKELYNMLTTTPANTWQLKGCGSLENDYYADIVIARKKNNLEGFNAYYAINPEDILMVVHKGNIRLFDAVLLEQLNDSINGTGNFSRFLINGSSKYVYGNLPGLMRQIKSYYPDVIFPIEIDN